MYAYLIATLRGTAGDVAFTNISARDINYSMCEFPSVTSGLKCAGFCSSLIKSCVA